jgi:hypothetical protein
MPKISIAHNKERLSILEKNIELLEIQVVRTIDALTPAFEELREIEDLAPSQTAQLSEIDGLLGYATSVKFKLRKCREELRKALGDTKETF